MKSLLKGICVFLIALLVSSCGLFKRIPVETHYRDSVIVSYKDSTIVKDSIAYVTIPVEQYINVTLPGQTSHLQTSLAESTAFTDSLGLLHHTLRNRSDQKIPVIVFNTEHYQTLQSTSSKSELTTRTVYVEKKLNWWQKFRLKGFWWLLGILIIENALLIFALKKKFSL